MCGFPDDGWWGAPDRRYSAGDGLGVGSDDGDTDAEKRLDVRERIEKLENKMTKVETALNVSL